MFLPKFSFMNKFLQTFLMIAMLLVGRQVMAQGVTTSNLTGRITDDKGAEVPGATIMVVHEPTGTRYGANSEIDGGFSIPNMRIGGPYTITVTMMGFQEKQQTEVYLNLGQTANINIQISESATQLTEIVLTGGGEGDKSGTSTRVSERMLNTLPTFDRSLNDFTRLTPQANVTGSRISFAGQNNRYNQFAIDGTVNNDAFGLNASGTNGGGSGTQPISIDAVEELQVVLAPYDVKLGGFTGGGINAVTRGGTNKFSGSAYYFGRNQSFVGKYDQTGTERALTVSKYEQFGARLGGPIIKNKLFFFANIEKTNEITPKDFAPGTTGSNFDPADLDLVYNKLKTLGYDAGSYMLLNDDTRSTKLFGRIDWNINDKHQLTVRHNFVDAESSSYTRSANTIGFSNNGVYRPNKTHTFVTEWRARFNNNMNNEFRFGYTDVRDDRGSQGTDFPSVSIRHNPPTGAFRTIFIGPEPSSSANALNQRTLTLTNNFTWKLNAKHTITIGTHNEFYRSSNLFIQNNFGNYTYNTLADFLTIGTASEVKPLQYRYNYYTKNPNEQYYVDLRSAQLGFYLQDDFQASDKLKLTYGVRMDVPIFTATPDANEAFNNEFEPMFDVATNAVPKTQPLFSPRVGFNYDMFENGRTVIRGGAGLFTGRVPFVWLSNQFSNTGTLFTQMTLLATSPSLRFRSDPYGQWSKEELLALPNPGNIPNPSSIINVSDKNFKYPQVFRTNIAIDQRIFWGMTATFEVMYSKTLNDIYYQNLNLKEPTRNLQLPVGATQGDTRPIWSNSTALNATDVYNTTYGGVYYIGNTNKGYSLNLTAQLTKPFKDGFSGSLAYTYGIATNLQEGGSSVAASNFNEILNVTGPNNLEYGRAGFDLGSRVVGTVSKTFKHENNATTFSIVYNGQSGQPYSYVYGTTPNASINNDFVTNDLLYIPRDGSEIVFSSTDPAVRAAQWEALNNFIEADKYLSKNRGKYAERNGARTPWENRFDLRILQEIGLHKNHKLQLSLDIMNIGNLIDRNWGADYSGGNVSLLRFESFQTGTTIPTFSFNETGVGQVIDGARRPYFKSDFFSRWRAQFGIRYIF